MNLKRVVITGLGAVTPIGNNVSDYWNSLLTGVNGANLITRFDTELYKTKFACELKGFDVLDYLDNKEARKMDPCSHYAIAATAEAIADSQLDLSKTDLERFGVILGTGIGGIISVSAGFHDFFAQDKNPRFISPFFIPKVLGDITAGIISIKYGLKGPNYATTSACASSGNAIADAFHLIQLGKATMMLTGGTEAPIVDLGLGGFIAMHALSTRNDDYLTASRPFDKDRDGFIMGEGAGVLLLEEYENARARGAKIYAELLAVGLTADAFHITSPPANGEGAYNSMKLAIADAQLNTTDIDHINTHGTSTPAGDIAECNAIANLFGEHAPKMVINSTKSMTGHLLGAAAAVEAIATILALKEGVIPPTINQFNRDPAINPNWNLADNKAVKRDINTAICNSFGFGGHNVSMLFKKFI